ncbi:MAG: pantoate--beta-alanine ligase [Chitinophagales bacterium]|nr:pantoate--beta-alanine ligase [Chitinophagales bacterium]
MIIFKKAADLGHYLAGQKKHNRSVGFVPTMGALHQGHISLLEASKKDNDITISSIFINPAQFNDPADFEKYPVTIEKDIYLLEKAGCDILFLPSVAEIYPDGFHNHKQYDLGKLETLLEGKFRPGHFQGVCMVVERLLTIVCPGKFYLGQKDYQQCMVINRLIQLMGIENDTALVVCPTLREPDGLAMSSRNMRLNEEERKKAVAIYNVLTGIKNNLRPSSLITMKNKAVEELAAKGFRVDYVEIADAVTLEPVTEWDGRQKLVALVAAFNNEVRLIDNMLIN